MPEPKTLGRVDWMPRLKVWRVIRYKGAADIPAGDYPTRKEAEDALRELVARGNPTPVTPEVIDISGLEKAIEMHRDWLEIPKKEIPGYPLLAHEDFTGLIEEKKFVLKAIEENKNLSKVLQLVNEYLDEHKFLLSRGVEVQGGWGQEKWVEYYSNLKEQLEGRIAKVATPKAVVTPVTPEVTAEFYTPLISGEKVYVGNKVKVKHPKTGKWMSGEVIKIERPTFGAARTQVRFSNGDEYYVTRHQIKEPEVAIPKAEAAVKGTKAPAEKGSLEQKANALLPMPPTDGPPLPRMFDLKWPWKK